MFTFYNANEIQTLNIYRALLIFSIQKKMCMQNQFAYLIYTHGQTIIYPFLRNVYKQFCSNKLKVIVIYTEYVLKDD